MFTHLDNNLHYKEYTSSEKYILGFNLNFSYYLCQPWSNTGLTMINCKAQFLYDG